MPTFYELVHSTEWDTVIGPLSDIIMKAHKDYGPDDFTLEPFKAVFDRLRTLAPVLDKQRPNGVLVIEHYHAEHTMSDDYIDPDTGTNLWVEDYEDVHALYPDEHPTQAYALDFTPWSEWLTLELDKQTLDNYSPGQILAECLWDMTFYGFTEPEINAKLQGLLRTHERVESGEEKMYSYEEVNAKLKKKIEDNKN